MCGIIHCKSYEKGKKVCKSVLKRYTTQKTRGKEGFGFIEIMDGMIVGIQRAETETEILALLAKSEADEIMFHHRFPTSTPNFIEATHPIYVSHESLKYDYYVVHNGVISNDIEMRTKHLEKGFTYSTECEKQYLTKGQTYTYGIEYNDSEAMAIDFALSIENNVDMESRGSIALVALQVDKETMMVVALYWGRNAGNPLKIEDYKQFFALSSESGKEIPIDMLYRMDYATGETTKEDKDIGTFFSYRRGGTTTYGGTNQNFGFDTPRSNHIDLPALPHKSSIGKDDEESSYDDFLPSNPVKDRELMEEEDYIIDLKLEIIELQDKLGRAYAKNDYDEALGIEIEIEGLQAELDSTKEYV